MRRLSCVWILATVLGTPLWAGGQAEGAGSSTFGRYLAGRGIILTEEQVHIDSYIASIDYGYPVLDDPIGLSITAGNYQLSNRGQETIVHIGIQGNEVEFEELPPMNLAFVIDKSASMDSEGKIDWVKRSFEVFIHRVRDQDFVALVVLDGSAHTLFPSTRMDSQEERIAFLNAVRGVHAGGGTNLLAGLKLGYEELSANYKSTYTNRVLLLTDGVGESEGLIQLAEQYRTKGINVSVIGVGSDFDVGLMLELAKKGGGSSRFIGDEEQMARTFGSELARMVVPVARDLEMELELLPGARLIETWGYDHETHGDVTRYSLNTMHLGDYETIVARLEIPATELLGKQTLGRFTVRYRDAGGRVLSAGPVLCQVDLVDKAEPISGYSNAMALKSGTMVSFGKALEDIAKLYYPDPAAGSKVVSEEERAHDLETALTIAVETKKELENAKLRLEEETFDDEIEMLARYIETIGKELELEQELVERMKRDDEIQAAVESRTLHECVADLVREMRLYLEDEQVKTIALTPFVSRTGGVEPTLHLLDEQVRAELSGMESTSIVGETRTADALRSLGLEAVDLMDTANALSVGRHLDVDHVLTGTVISMARSTVVFSRIINVETEAIESTAQVVVPKPER